MEKAITITGPIEAL